MRNMSFSLTTEQVRQRTKTVTRRLGWTFLRAGDTVLAVVKSQGLRKGERVEPLGILHVTYVRREILGVVSDDDVALEGFPGMPRKQFVAMFCDSHKGCTPQTIVTRIEFRYEGQP